MTPALQVLDFEKPLADLETMLSRLKDHNETHDLNVAQEIRDLEDKLTAARHEIYDNLTPIQRVQIARHPSRPYFLDYATGCFDEFHELHGDRIYADDQALIGGFARLDGQPVMLIGHQKGRDTKERTRRNFGMANPEGYRKALRLMRLAARFSLPIITFVDTPGAFPGVESEERHIAEAIAVNLREMFALAVPVITVIIGEGGSGGALGIAIADRVLILENSYYSVISPEGCAAILWKDRTHAPQAAEALKITARDLKRLELVDEIIDEPLGGAHHDPEATHGMVRKALVRQLAAMSKLKPAALLKHRHEKFRAMGQFIERT